MAVPTMTRASRRRPGGEPPAASSENKQLRRSFLARASGWLLGGPMALYVALFFAVPLVLLIIYSVSEFDLLTLTTRPGFTFDNYSNVFSETYVGAILRSFVMTLVMIVACVLLGYPVALTISRMKGRAKAVLLIAIIVPYWISFIVRVYAWLDLLAPSGVVSQAAAFFGVIPQGAQLGYSDFAVGIGMIAGYLPLMILPLFMALDRIDPAMVEAASDMGLTRMKTFWKVIVPLSMPGAIAGVLLVGIPATGEYTIPAVLGGGQSVMAGNLQADAFLSTGNYPFGAAIATVLLALMLALLFLFRKKLDRLGDIT